MYQRALQGKEKALGAEHTSTLDTVYNLGILYMNQGKLAEAEQMYQRALQGYEKAVGIDNITTYIPALDTFWGLGDLYKRQADLAKAGTMYSKALVGYEKVFGPDHSNSWKLRDNIRGLDTMREQGHNRRERSRRTNFKEETLHLGGEGTSQKSKTPPRGRVKTGII
jgi:tetratricopeptide (TPR) repeat protein